MRDIITTIIKNELINPTFEMTRQYLKILAIEFENDLPKILNIDTDLIDGKIIAYVKVKSQPFYIQFMFDTAEGIKIYSVDTAPYIHISYSPISKEDSLETLLSLISITPSNTIPKDDFPNGSCNYCGIEFETDSTPGRIDSKLISLLNVLETDVEGIRKLSRRTNCYHLFVTIMYHSADWNFTGLWLDRQVINRLSNLGLELVFDIYAHGDKFNTQ